MSYFFPDWRILSSGLGVHTPPETVRNLLLHEAAWVEIPLIFSGPYLQPWYVS